MAINTMSAFARLVALGCAVAGLSGCATVTRGTTETVNFESTPTGAVVSTSLGQSCTTPCALDIARKDEFTAAFALPGYSPQTVEVKTGLGTGGGAAMVGNAVLPGGLAGAGIDLYNGAQLDHSPNPVTVTLEPIAAPRSKGKKSRGGRKAKTS